MYINRCRTGARARGGGGGAGGGGGGGGTAIYIYLPLFTHECLATLLWWPNIDLKKKEKNFRII